MEENYLMSFLIQGIEVIKQEIMTDYDFFKTSKNRKTLQNYAF